jgi:hypothetical protein
MGNNSYNYTAASGTNNGGFNNEYQSQHTNQSQGYNSLTSNVHFVDNMDYSSTGFGSNNVDYPPPVPSIIRSNSLGIIIYIYFIILIFI